jgi:hypothetical protein
MPRLACGTVASSFRRGRRALSPHVIILLQGKIMSIFKDCMVRLMVAALPCVIPGFW